MSHTEEKNQTNKSLTATINVPKNKPKICDDKIMDHPKSLTKSEIQDKENIDLSLQMSSMKLEQKSKVAEKKPSHVS